MILFLNHCPDYIRSGPEAFPLRHTILNPQKTLKITEFPFRRKKSQSKKGTYTFLPLSVETKSLEKCTSLSRLEFIAEPASVPGFKKSGTRLRPRFRGSAEGDLYRETAIL